MTIMTQSMTSEPSRISLHKIPQSYQSPAMIGCMIITGKPVTLDSMVAVYTAFRDAVSDPASVLYPCCGWDASPSAVFRRVTYVDREDWGRGSMESFRQAGLDARKLDIKDYQPAEAHDMLILMKPRIPTEWASRHIVPGAYILSDDHNENAKEMRDDPLRYRMIGGISFLNRDPYALDFRVFVTLDTTDLLVPVKDEQELKEHRPDHHRFITTTYPPVMQMVGHEVPAKFEDMYLKFVRHMGWREELPARRVADYYIFVKK